tara:strand:- start:162 stop:701 length:540 start_codon:yes stop_codon:yes gene_type:complete
MDRTRDLAQGLTRISNKQGKYKTVRVVPTLDTSEYVSGDVLFKPTEIKGACLGNGTSVLKQIKMFCLDDEKKDVSLVFFENEPTVEALNVASALFTATGGDNTDALVKAANPFGAVLLDVNGSNTTVLDYANLMVYIQGSVDLYVNSVSGSIYVMGIATGSDTYTAATDLEFDFIFERA